MRSAMDVRHWQDEAPQAGEGDGLLQRLQESMRQLDPSLVQPLRDGEAAALADRSLRVHLCHTRLRELEVLRDALLKELSERPDLKPSDIVVMAPDIAAYVPLLPAVFGEAGRHQGPLPYHLADVAVARTHPMLDAFSRLLSMPESRLTAPELLDLMQVPEVARALGLDESDLDTLTRWLRQSRVAWALDGGFREGFGVPGIDEHTFAWGMDRLLAGYVLGDDGMDEAGEGWTLPDGELWPVEGVHGPQAAVLGALDRLLLALAELHRDAAEPRTASAWATPAGNACSMRCSASTRAITRRSRRCRCCAASCRRPSWRPPTAGSIRCSNFRWCAKCCASAWPRRRSASASCSAASPSAAWFRSARSRSG